MTQETRHFFAVTQVKDLLVFQELKLFVLEASVALVASIALVASVASEHLLVDVELSQVVSCSSPPEETSSTRGGEQHVVSAGARG